MSYNDKLGNVVNSIGLLVQRGLWGWVVHAISKKGDDKMETIKTNCPECNQQMEYWTKSKFITCPKCKSIVEVEPCKEELIEEQLEEELIEEENE